MKKFLLSLAAVLCAGSLAMADEVTVQLNSSTGFTGDANAYTAANSGFTFTYAKASSSNACVDPKNDHIRIYKGAEFIVESGDGVTITKMVMTSTGSSYNQFTSANPGEGSASGSTYTWTGTASKVTFSNTSAQSRLKQIVITYTTASEVVSAPEFSVPGGIYSEPVTVTITADSGCDIYYTTDNTVPTDESAFYEAPITINKTTVLRAVAYKGAIASNPRDVTYTIVELKEGAEGEGTEINPYNAIAAYNEAILGSAEKVYVTGTISEITDIDTGSYGNASYYISTDGSTNDQFYIFRGFALGGLKFTAKDQIKVGDKVVVLGNLTTYQGVPQIDRDSEIVKLNGEIYTIVTEGDGSESNPFTVADIIKINPTDTKNNTSYPDKYWITGYIVGASDKSNSSFNPIFDASVFSGNNNYNANIALGATAESTTGLIPVQLPSSGNVRTALNLADNPSNLGKQVTVYGNILNYLNAPGVKNTTQYTFGTSAIDAIDADDSDAPVEYFNLQGVRVDEPQNGLYLRRQGSTVTKVIVK